MMEKNDRIFSQLEDAVSLSLKPLDNIFESAGLDADRILTTVRRGYSGQGGLSPITMVLYGTMVQHDRAGIGAPDRARPTNVNCKDQEESTTNKIRPTARFA